MFYLGQKKRIKHSTKIWIYDITKICKVQNTQHELKFRHSLGVLWQNIRELSIRLISLTCCFYLYKQDYFIEKNWLDKEAEDGSEGSCEEEKGKRKAATYGKVYYNKRKDHLTNYTCKCLEICWYMAIQSPPVYLDFSYKKGNCFNKSVLKHYTRDGKIIDFLVWPATYLEKGGTLLGKGVAQPESKAST